MDLPDGGLLIKKSRMGEKFFIRGMVEILHNWVRLSEK